jgi:hypothetical protein
VSRTCAAIQRNENGAQFNPNPKALAKTLRGKEREKSLGAFATWRELIIVADRAHLGRLTPST